MKNIMVSVPSSICIKWVKESNSHSSEKDIVKLMRDHCEKHC